MATALPNIHDVECCICFEIFKTPKILSCGHSLCLECLVRYIDGRQGTFPCPICKQAVKIPRGGVIKFVTNFSLQTMSDSLRTTDISTIQPSTNLQPKHHCPNHSKKEVEYYCQTCSLGLCSKCIYKDHKDHKTLDLECDSTRKMVVEELSNSELLVKNTIEDLAKTHAALLKTSEKLKYFCDEACSKISEETENIIGELRKHCNKIQKDIKLHFDKNEKNLTETRQKVMTQMNNIKINLDTACPTETKEPSLTLIYSLNKLKHLQKLCENMKTVIPPVTYVEWREGSVKVCDILGSTETKTLYQSNEGTVFKFNDKDIKEDDVDYYSKDKCLSRRVVWSCKGWIHKLSYHYLQINIGFLRKDNPQVDNCEIKYTLTLINKDKDKNVISKTSTEILPSDLLFQESDIQISWYKLTDLSEGFIDNEGQFLVRLDILDMKYGEQ